MSNGVAYVLDEAGTFETRVNQDMVALETLEDEDAHVLLRLIREHEEKTASPRARTILVQWESVRPLFRRVAPKNAPTLISTTRSAFLRRSLVEPLVSGEVRRSA